MKNTFIITIATVIVLTLSYCNTENDKELDLNGQGLTSLPQDVFQKQDLEWLDLDDNNLTSLPPEISKLQNLTYLSLYDSELTSLPSEIGNLQNLSYLYIYDNNIPEAEIQKIESWLPNCEIIWENPYD